MLVSTCSSGDVWRNIGCGFSRSSWNLLSPCQSIISWHRETLSLSFIQVPARTPNPKRPRLIFPENPHILRAVVDEADNAVRRPAVFVPNLLEHGNLVPLLRQPEIWKIIGN